MKFFKVFGKFLIALLRAAMLAVWAVLMIYPLNMSIELWFGRGRMHLIGKNSLPIPFTLPQHLFYSIVSRTRAWKNYSNNYLAP